MTYNNQLFYLMQMAGGTFPSGGFSQSWGLETYVAAGTVHDDKTFIEFTEGYLESTITRCEGPIMREAYRLAAAWTAAEAGGACELESAGILGTGGAEQQSGPLDELLRLEELSCAVKVTKESRESSIRMGKAFMRIMADILDDENLSRLKKLCGPDGISYPVIYGAVCGRIGVDIAEAMKAFVFSTVNALVQSAVKLVPLGNTQAQQVLLQLYPAMEASAKGSMETPVDEISNFCPGLDIASINHEFLTTRLYMS